MNRKAIPYLLGLLVLVVVAGLAVWYLLSSRGQQVGTAVWYVSSEFPRELVREKDPPTPDASTQAGPRDFTPVYVTLSLRFSESEWERSDMHRLTAPGLGDFYLSGPINNCTFRDFLTVEHSVAG